MEAQVITPDAVTKIVATLTPAQLRITYEFVAFLRSRTDTDALSRELDAWDTASDEDAAWMGHLTASDTSEFAALRKQAIADIDAGLSTPMFNDAGELVTE